KNKMRPVYLAAAVVACLFIVSGIYFTVIRNPENYKTEVAALPLKKEEIKPAVPPAPPVNNSSEKLSESVDKPALVKNKTETKAKTELNQASKNESVQTTVAATETGMNEKDMGVSAQSRSSMEYSSAVAADEIAKSEAPVIADRNTVPAQDVVKTSELKMITTDSIRTTTSENYSKAENARGSAKERLMEKRNSHEPQQTNIDDALKDVQRKIEYENYKAALKELKQLSNEHPGDMNVIYNIGMVYYKTNETAKALTCFDQVLNSSDKELFEDARLHKALTYVKMNDKQNARKILSHIISEKGIYKERAEGILEQMDGN
ncbi:MAG: tetratricopeptide repeat protein, partial [Bacteroidota bacterium]